LQYIFNELKIKKKKENIEIRVEPDCLKKNVFIETDPLRLKQILNNLLENSLKYTFRGYIEFGFEDMKDNLKFFVKDTGVGIKKENQDFIFERFAQVYSTTDKRSGGTGLGLSICKNLIELLGGKVWLESELSIGSIFYFTLPYKEIKIEDRLKTGDSGISRKKVKSDYNWNNKIILIAEDEELNFKVLESALARTNVNILRASDGVEAVKIAKNKKCNLVLMDIQMPNMDGYLATKEIKRINSSLPIIAQTSFAMTGDKNKCFEAGCDDYLSKPFNLEELLIKIDKYIC
jgi:CheY-like chemotaxis protein